MASSTTATMASARIFTKLKPGTKLISISSVDLITKSNYQDFQRFQSIDISMPGDAEATLPSLIEAVKSAISNDRKDAMSKRGDAIRQAHAKGLEATKQAAAIAWDASPVNTARLVTELYAQIKDLDWSLVSTSGNTSNWANRLWPMEKHYQWLGSSGGYGVGYGAPASVGAALGNRDQGRFSVSIQSDGDLMYAPGVLWTAVRHKIPLLAVMHNNRGYHQEAMHVLRFANFRNRVVNTGNDLAPIGTSIMNPGHPVSRSGEIDGVVGERADHRSGRSRSGDQGSGQRGQGRPAGADQRFDAAALRG